MTGLAADPACKEHRTGLRHPEQPARFDAALDALKGLQLLTIKSRVATEDEISLCHDLRYIRLVEREVQIGSHELSTGDTIISAGSLDAALRATGAALNAVDAVLIRRSITRSASCVLRATTPRRRRAWDFAFSTVSPSPPAMLSASTASNEF
jgi:acetoin utilization deacetylase AcuC-like enzyme